MEWWIISYREQNCQQHRPFSRISRCVWMKECNNVTWIVLSLSINPPNLLISPNEEIERGFSRRSLSVIDNKTDPSIWNWQIRLSARIRVIILFQVESGTIICSSFHPITSNSMKEGTKCNSPSIDLSSKGRRERERREEVTLLPRVSQTRSHIYRIHCDEATKRP